MLEIIWGIKTKAMLDVWSIEHILSGMSIGYFVSKFNTKLWIKHGLSTMPTIFKKYADVIAILFLAFTWETFEHYIEIGLCGEWLKYWFQGVEFWPNRLIFDPLCMWLGYVFITRYTRYILVARVASFVWLFIHLFIFPHSMYLHELF
ncbi:hypothetical protein DID76_02680 [Candidatus Marinamargulisbacteria bacterium SCGC AG-414-C22]|nr:hypothetical protein DID76_02680 [Candidatus Marinamargulisbacteria bacterium SCGC AG-414-C22]